MATNIKLKRSSVAGKKPTVSDLALGELGLNTFDGKLFVKIDRSGAESIVGIGAEEPGNQYFVTKNGVDTNDGKSIGNAFATVKAALAVATTGDTVQIGPGTYTEIFPLDIPVGVSVIGGGIRSTFIQPTSGTKDLDGFRMNGETEVSDLTIGNFFYNSTNDTGYAFRFKSGMKTTTRSPYIQRVTVFNKGSVTSSTDPFGFDTVNNPPVSYISGRGALIDASVVDATTLEPAMLFNECTFICPNNIGLKMTNGARTEWVNCFTYFCSKSIEALDGSTGIAGVGKTRLKFSGLNVTTTPAANDIVYYLEATFRAGTYTRTGTTVTITQNSHGLNNGDKIYADYTSGTATDGFYTVANKTTNTFDVTDPNSGTISTSNVSFKKALAYGTVSSYSSGTTILTNKGTGTFTIATTTGGKLVTTSGNCSLSTAQKKFGTASLYLDGTDDYARCEGGTDFAFASNFTVEGWIYPTSVTGNRYLFSLGTETTGRYNLFLVSGVLTGNFYGSTSTTFGGSISINTWTHIALVRSGSTITVYVNGTALGTTETNSSAIGNTGQLTIGADTTGVNNFAGYIDEFRISNNARYTGTFTTATTQFNSDGNDKLILHFDGVTGSTSIIDSSLPTQDVRFISGTTTVATASKITLADYQQFGAEMRSIGSASVFGTQGITVDGPGCTLRLFAYNFGHIGSGKDFSQDETLVVQANEAVETNNGKIYYVSIDQGGDFRVGDAFYVSQRDGTVNFGGQDFTLNSLSDLNVTDGTNTTTITPVAITVGNLNLTGNTLSTTSGNLTIDPSGSGSTTINGDVIINGTLSATTASLSGIIQGDSQVTITDTGANGTINLVADATTVQTVTSTGVTITGTLTVTGNTTFQSNAYFGDNDSAYFGDGNDLRIAHDGSNTFIQDVGAGVLNIQSDGTGINLQKVGGENLARFLTDGAVELYYDNVKKFETTTTGVLVTGKTATTTLEVNSNSQIATNSTTITSSTAQFVADSFSSTSYRTTKYLIQVQETGGSNFYSSEVLLMHDGTNVYLTEYGTVSTTSSPVSFIDADINSGNVRLLITPSVGNTTTKISKISLTA